VQTTRWSTLRLYTRPRVISLSEVRPTQSLWFRLTNDTNQANEELIESRRPLTDRHAEGFQVKLEENPCEDVVLTWSAPRTDCLGTTCTYLVRRGHVQQHESNRSQRIGTS
jgi:hypothetical protein